MAKASPLMTDKQRMKFYSEKRVAKNAEALAVRRGISQAERNRELQDFVAALRAWARQRMDCMIYEDIDAFIKRFRARSAAREGGAGPDPPRKAKGKR